MNDINNRLKFLRNHKKLSQDSFGDALGITGASISRYEAGNREISDSLIKLVCQTFNISESWLRTGEGEMEVKPPEDLVDRLAREYNLGVGGVALLRAAARVINEFPEDVALRMIEEIISDLQQAVAARQAVSDPEARVVADPQASADDQSSLPPAGSRLG